MLGGGHQRARRISQNCREFGGCDGVDMGANLALAPTLKFSPDEPDPGSGVGRMQSNRDRKTRMNAHAGEYGLVSQRRLTSDFHTFVPPSRMPELRHASPATLITPPHQSH